jgi:hypothetical protein
MEGSHQCSDAPKATTLCNVADTFSGTTMKIVLETNSAIIQKCWATYQYEMKLCEMKLLLIFLNMNAQFSLRQIKGPSH